MPLTVQEAATLGASKLNISMPLFQKAFEVAMEMGVREQDAGPMALALAIMGVAKAHDPKELEAELTDALALVSQAENEWRLERKGMN